MADVTRNRPILFSGPMVRAILAGRKTQTRRILSARERAEMRPDADTDDPAVVNAVRFAPGHRLWVKETWRPRVVRSHGANSCDCADVSVRYEADGAECFFADERVSADWVLPKAAKRGNVTPLFMPRWASRITLEVLAVRVERLQDITEEGARAEGFPLPGPQPTRIRVTDIDGTVSESLGLAVHMTAPRGAFCSLWDGINGKRAPWASNPWVWVVEFRRLP